jgi:transcriptional regulator with XRE-family HTH domain
MTNPRPPFANLRAELARAGLFQKDVAAVLGQPQPQISKRLSGEIPWRLTELQAIATHLNIPVSRLIDEPVAADQTAQSA